MNTAEIIFQKDLGIGLYQVHQEKPNFSFKEVQQVHGNTIINEEYLNNQEIKQADGILSRSQAKIMIKTADCLPIVIIGEKGHALIHAGWRGVKKKVYLHPFIESINPQLVFVGPHIQKESFEVTEDFRQQFPSSQELFEIFENKLTFDLFRQVKRDLLENFPSLNIINSNIDTFSNLNFHSYRRNSTTKRNWNLFCPYSE